MRRTKEYNKNSRIIKQILNIAKRYGIRDIAKGDGYLTKEGRNTILAFTLPNNYRVGVWLYHNKIFAEHEHTIDKFTPSRCEFNIEYKDFKGIKEFLDKVAEHSNKDADIEMGRLDRLSKKVKYRVYDILKNNPYIESFTMVDEYMFKERYIKTYADIVADNENDFCNKVELILNSLKEVKGYCSEDYFFELGDIGWYLEYVNKYSYWRWHNHSDSWLNSRKIMLTYGR